MNTDQVNDQQQDLETEPQEEDADASTDTSDPDEDASGQSPGQPEPDNTLQTQPGPNPQQSSPDESPSSPAHDQEQNDIKIVLSIDAGSARIGAQKPAADPVIESFDTLDIDVLVQELPAFLQRTQHQWAESLTYPKHVTPPKPRRTGRNQAQQQPPAEPPAPEPPPAPRARTLSLFDEQ